MAMQTEVPLSPPSAQVVGNAFVEQYYHILHHSPELVYRFYQDSSVLSRPDVSGVMASVTTMKDINDKICSLDYKNYKAEIKTADSQDSFKDGVIVLVTGCLTGKDNLRRKFTQTFFLAPQDKGYFVLNDIFRYVDEKEPDNNLGTAKVTDEAPISSLTPEAEPAHVLDPPIVEQEASHIGVVTNGEDQAQEQVENYNQVASVREIVVEGTPQTHENNNSAVAEPAISTAHGDAPKKSYASILSSQTKKGPTGVYVPTTSKPAPARTENNTVVSVAPDASAPTAPSSPPEPEEKDGEDEVEGHSVYVRNLPLSVTVAQVEVEFRKFGPIKQGGVQVRSNKQQGFCFGFVEYQDLSSMHAAIEASPVTIGGCQAVVEIKRTTTRVGNSSRGRFLSGRGGSFRDSFRGRGNFSGGHQSYWMAADYGDRGDFSARGRDGHDDISGRGRGGHGDFSGRGRGGHGDFSGRGRGGHGEFSGRGRGGHGDFSGRGRGGPSGRGGETFHQQGRGRGGGRRGVTSQNVASM